MSIKNFDAIKVLQSDSFAFRDLFSGKYDNMLIFFTKDKGFKDNFVTSNSKNNKQFNTLFTVMFKFKWMTMTKVISQARLNCVRDVYERIVPMLAFSLYFDQNFKDSFHADAD